MSFVKYVNECIGTFFLVLTVGLTIVGVDPNGIGLLAPLAIGSSLAVMVYAGGHISGGHYNPAVSLAVFLRNKLTGGDLIGYWIAQVLGGVVAAFVVIFVKGQTAASPLVLDPTKALFVEFLFTFALCHVVLNTAVAKATQGNSYFGFAIGFVVVVGAYAVGAVSGAAFNPAVAVGASIMNLSSWADLWIFVVSNLLGGAVAAAVFKFSHVNE